MHALLLLVVQDPQLAAVLLGDNIAAIQDLLRSTYQVSLSGQQSPVSRTGRQRYLEIVCF